MNYEENKELISDIKWTHIYIDDKDHASKEIVLIDVTKEFATEFFKKLTNKNHPYYYPWYFSNGDRYSLSICCRLGRK